MIFVFRVLQSLVAASLICAHGSTFASNNKGDLTGKVVDSGKNPISDADILITWLERFEETIPPKISESDGSFSVSLPHGSYSVTAWKGTPTGCWLSTKTTTISANKKNSIDLTADPSPCLGQGSMSEPRSGGSFLLHLPALWRLRPFFNPFQGSSWEPKYAELSGSRDRSDKKPVEIKGVVEGKTQSSALLIIRDFSTSREVARIKTDASGQYVMSLPRGADYLLLAFAVDYQSAVFVLRVARNGSVSLVDKAGKVTGAERIKLEIEDLVQPLESSNYSRYFNFNASAIEALPLSGTRRIDDLALLLPGVAPAPATFGKVGPSFSPTVGTAGQFASNGLRSRENNFTVDGSDNNDEDLGVRRQGFVALFPQTIESVAEFQVITLLADARFGRSIGGQVNALSKYGQSQFHGTAYGFVTGSLFMARDFFDLTRNSYQGEARERIPLTTNGRLEGSPVRLDLGAGAISGLHAINGLGFQANPIGGEDSFTRANAGFVFGGPIPRTKGFIFTSFERQTVHSGQETHFAVPTLQQRGLFERGDKGLGSTENAAYPASLEGNAIFSLYPFPNNPLGPYGPNTFTQNLPADGLSKQFSVKGDYQFKTAHMLTFRYNYTSENSVLPSTGGALFSSLRPQIKTYNGALFFNTTFSKWWNTFRSSFGRTNATFDEVRDPMLLPASEFSNYSFLLNAPLFLNLSSPQSEQPRLVSASSSEGLRQLGLLGLSADTLTTDKINGPLGQLKIAGFSPLGIDVFRFPQRRFHSTVQFADTMTLVRGKHTIMVGFDLRRVYLNSTVERNVRPLVVFHGIRRIPESEIPVNQPCGGIFGCPAAGPLTIPDVDDVFSGTTLAAAGSPVGVFRTLTADPDLGLKLRRTNGEYFIQNEFRYKPNLQLHFGARIAGSPLPKDVDQRFLSAFNFDELTRQALEVRSRPNCDARCQAIVNSLQRTFPANFGSTFGADPSEFDPRFGFAWSPSWASKMVLRGGVGAYSSTFPAIIINEARNVFPGFLPLNLGRQTDVRDPFNPRGVLSRYLRDGSLNHLVQASGPNFNPISFLALDLRVLEPTLAITVPGENLKNPSAYHWGITVERELAAQTVGTLSYAGTIGRKLLRVATPNFGAYRSQLRFQGITAQPGQSPFPLAHITLFYPGVQLSRDFTNAESFVPVPITRLEGTANSRYHALQAELRKSYRQRFYCNVAFTYSHAIDEVSDFFDLGGAFALPQNSLQRSESGSANFDVRLRSVTTFAWDLPSFVGTKAAQGWKARVFQGWQLAGIYTAQTGQPFTVNSIVDSNLDGNATDRLATTQGLITDPFRGDRRIKLSVAPGLDLASLLAPTGHDGLVGRNTFRATGIQNLDLALVKKVPLGHNHTLLFRTEMFNAFNRAHFGIPVRILEHPSFGRSVSTALPPRTIQFALKYSF